MTLAGLGVFMPAPARPDAAKLKDAPVITVLSANLLHQNRSFDELIDFIVHHDPDIILFQEYGDNADRVLPDRFGVEYPHMVRAKRDDAFGAGVFSRIPFAEPPKPFAAAKSIGGQVVPQVRCVIEVAGEKVVVQNMHPPPPVSVSLLTEQRRLLRWLEGTIEPDAPMIAAGDFNSTPQSVSNARLRKAGWIESQAQVRGLSRGATWPALSVLRFAPGVRIDQLFHSPRLVCEMTEVGPAFGSDHLPIVARYRVLQREDGAGSGKAEDR